MVDSWGRESTITRNLVITNGIQKNTIKFMDGNSSILEIGFNPNTNKLILNGYNYQFGPGNRISNYVGITIKKKGQSTSSNITAQFTGNEKPVDNNGQLVSKFDDFKSYNLNYGDTIVLYSSTSI